MEAVNDGYQIPSCKHLTTKMLPERSATIQRLILPNLQKTFLVCVTVDLWTNRQLFSYFEITAHFITSCDWDLKSVMLSCSRFRVSHTADATMDQFQSVISEFDMFTFTVMDSAANMLKAFSNPNFEKTGRNNLEGEESDDNYDDENEDSVTIDDLETLQFYDDLGNVSEHSPCFAHMLQLVIKDGFKASNVTRWNSQLMMIRSILRIPGHSQLI